MTTTLSSVKETAAPPLGERCDMCSAAAKVRAVLSGGRDLVFCSHHANKYTDGLKKVAIEFSPFTPSDN